MPVWDEMTKKVNFYPSCSIFLLALACAVYACRRIIPRKNKKDGKTEREDPSVFSSFI